MTFANYASDRRSRTRIRPFHRAEPHPIQDLRRGYAGALVVSLPRHDARTGQARPTWSSLTVKAATTLSWSAGHALPALLFAFFSWAVAEVLIGFAASAEAMYAPPVPAEPQRGARPSVSLMTMQAAGGSARPGARAVALPAEPRNNAPASRAERASVARLAAACWSRLRRAWDRRRAVAELRGLDDRSLRDIGISRADIETIARYGTRRE